MTDLVNRQKQILVRRGTDDVRCEEERPGDRMRVAEQVRAGDLERDDEENDPFRQWFWTAEFRDLYHHQTY